MHGTPGGQVEKSANKTKNQSKLSSAVVSLVMVFIWPNAIPFSFYHKSHYSNYSYRTLLWRIQLRRGFQLQFCGCRVIKSLKQKPINGKPTLETLIMFNTKRKLN